MLNDVDLERAIDAIAESKGLKLNWKNSIVELLHLLGLPDDEAFRLDFARRLGYDREASDMAGLNLWLRVQILRRIATNGGKVPADLAPRGLGQP